MIQFAFPKMKTSIKYWIITLCAFLYGLSTTGQSINVSKWKSFEKNSFQFQDREAWIVKPHKPVAGNPWVWRAHFPDWHTEMDSILLSRGFHVVYVNTNDLYGNPQAMNVWDGFYDFLVQEKGFAPKVALEGVSRGGLYVYNWAKRNPDKVSCIYAEAPVCDPRSWPGGKGKGKGSEKDWALWMNLYKLDEAGAAAFTDIPLNNLEGLASYKVPIFHAVSLDDKIVPNAENSDLLIQNYMKLGGPVQVYTMTRGKQNLEGHHFYIEHPDRIADFIYNHSVPVKKPLLHKPYVELGRSFKNTYDRFRLEKKGTVAFLGGSITYNTGWRTKTAQYLREQFPETEFNFIAAGIPSLGSTAHAFRFERDVLEQGIPDLLFIESAVNDRGNEFSGQAQIRALEGIIRQMYQKNPNANIVLMAFADPDKNGDYQQGIEPVEVKVHQQVAQHYGASFINLAREVYDRIQAGEFSWEYDFKDLHPSPFGQEIYFQTIKSLLKTSGEGSKDSFKLPELMDPFAYQKGYYGAVSQARKMKGFTLISNWKPKDNLSTRAGFVEVPVLEGNGVGSSFEFEFVGRAVGMAVISGADAGSFTYRIDGGKKRTRDLKTKWSRQLHLPWYIMLDDKLKNGKHTLHVEISANSESDQERNTVRIVHFLVNQ
jgi:sialidase-1